MKWKNLNCYSFDKCIHSCNLHPIKIHTSTITPESSLMLLPVSQSSPITHPC